MAKAPDWLPNIENIIVTVERAPANSRMIRLDIERAFGVKRTEAARIMQIAGAQLTGRDVTIARESLLAFLKLRRERDLPKVRSRREKVVSAVHAGNLETPARRGLIFRLQQSMPRMDRLSPDISFAEPGVLKIAYLDGQDLAQKLFDLAKAMQFDGAIYLEITGEPEDVLAGAPDGDAALADEPLVCARGGCGS